MRQFAWLLKYRQFLSFGLIGVVNTAIHGFILIMAVEMIQLNVTLANLLAFLVANLFSYVTNSRLTFQTYMSFARYIRFFQASIISLGLTLVISWTAERYGFHYLVGFSLVVILVPVLSFLVMKFWVFKYITDSRNKIR